MAEVLGVVASGMSVVSLAVQVAESIHKLRGFYSLMQSAPNEIAFLLDELETLSLILEDIDRSAQNEVFFNPGVKAAVMRSYRLCRSSGEGLAGLAHELEEGLKIGKKRGALKVAMKKDKIEELRKRLETMKSTMLLANQCYNQAINQQNWEAHERDMVKITAVLSNISHIASSSYIASTNESRARDRIESAHEDTTIEAGLDATRSKCRSFHYKTRPETGSVVFTGTKKLFGQLEVVFLSDGRKSKTCIVLQLPSWIHARRYQFCLSKSYYGWQQSLRSYVVVSYDHLVFQYCIDGNVPGLQELFQDRKASPFVVDCDGRSPLHYAALNARPEACLFLLENGADINLRTSWGSQLFRDKRVFRKLRVPPFCGCSAYSTPLHLLSSVTYIRLLLPTRPLLRGFYQGLAKGIMEDIRNTLKVLVSKGGADLLLRDRNKRTVFHLFDGPSDVIRWLKRQCGEEFKSMTNSELLSLLAFRLSMRPHRLVEQFREYMPAGNITKAIATWQTLGEEIHPGYSLLRLASWNFVHQSLDLKGLEKIILELVIAGADVHSILHQRTNILHMIAWCIGFAELKKTEEIIIRWLKLLHTAGIDLVEFGRVENALHDDGRTFWVFGKNFGGNEYPNFCQFELLKLQIGEAPDDLCMEFEDLYVSAGLAADFWVWVEEPAGLNDGEMMIPGAWIDD